MTKASSTFPQVWKSSTSSFFSCLPAKFHVTATSMYLHCTSTTCICARTCARIRGQEEWRMGERGGKGERRGSEVGAGRP